ncbi:tetratricopeptide repeat protein [candidate division KSB1 bacterium]
MVRHRYSIIAIFLVSIMIVFTSGNIHAQTAQEYYEQGLALKETGDIDGAIEMFDKALRLDLGFADANYELARCYMSQGTIRGRILAESALNRALRREFDNTEYIFVLAQLQIMQNMELNAINTLKKLIDIDPEHHEARTLLARLSIRTGWYGNLLKAENLLNETTENDFGAGSQEYSQGIIHFVDEKYILAEFDFLKHLELNSGHAEAKILLGQTYYHMREYGKATEYYLEGLEELTNPQMLSGIYTDMKWLFEDDERREFSSTPPSLQGKYLADYWNRYDTNVMTRENERLMEHMRRVEYVKEHYHSITDYGREYDDRGMIYLRYGEPDNSHKSISGGFNNIASDGSYNTEFGAWGFSSNESWVYYMQPYELSYDFANTSTGSYRLGGIPLSDYMDRGFLGGIYSRMAAFAFAMQVDPAGWAGGSVRIYSDMSMERDLAEANAPRQRFFLDFEEEPLDFYWSVEQFRGMGGETDVELNLGLPHKEIEFIGEPEAFTAEVETRLVIIDSVQVRQIDRTYPHYITFPKVTGTESLLSSEIVPLVPGEYRFGIQAKQEGAKKLGIYQPEITVRDFSGGGLMVSDIKMTVEQPRESIPVIRSREELELQPYPFPFVSRKEPLALYFEVYNLLTNPDDRAFYTLTYTIEPVPSDPPMVESFLRKLGRFLAGKRHPRISITQEREGTGRTAYELIYADISNINTMNALITVTVRDKMSRQTAGVMRAIKIIN